MKTVTGSMIGEGLQRPATDGILQRLPGDFGAQTILRFPARTAAAAVRNPTAAAGSESEITEHYHPPGTLRPPAYTEVYPAETPTRRIPAQREPKQICYRPADGFAYLRRALEALQMIRPHDLQKERAFAKLRQWLVDHE